jgi:hypothetical protein
MPKQITLLKIFVASPSDIIEERNILEEIVRNLNKQLGPILGINLEILKWETDTYPSIGEDPQSVINEQIGDDYDIFIGILWTRFGTPTNKAMSGTEEEFINAYKRAREKPNSVKVMVYFNEKPVSMSELDSEQVARVKTFQSSLGPMGAYYWQYKEIGDFSRYVNLQLGTVMKEYGSKWGQKIEAKIEHVEQPEQVLEIGLEETDMEEEGFLDLIISSVNDFANGSAAIGRIGELTKEIGAKTQARTDEINQLDKPINPNQAKLIINQFAEDQEYFVERMKVEIPNLSNSFRSAIDKWAKSAQIWEDFDSQDKSQIVDALAAIKAFQDAVGNAKKGTTNFRDTVNGLPRMTTRLNHSKRRVVEILDTLIGEYTIEESLSQEAAKVFVEILKKD